MDTEFNKKIPLLLEPFAWVLLDHRKNIKIRIEPEKVKAATDMYRKQNDIYRQSDFNNSSTGLLEELGGFNACLSRNKFFSCCFLAFFVLLEASLIISLDSNIA